ncbi:MAG: aminotransferase class I/II-fold pyridoxal phosphate-dependent enzyme [bacterium]|nr:aminotransferase class I/II-fold pyridoxal phosphate-dependent enzyme [bacterium]
MANLPKRIPRVAPKSYEYVKQVLDFGFHNSHSVGMTARLEREFAERFGQTYGIAHCNGTATMQSALMAAGVGVGDEVIVPTFTVFSTPAAVLHCNAIPIIVDVDPDTWTISIDAIRKHITPRTRAIIPVSICGLPADMDPIMELAEEHNLVVIEDNAQSILGYYKGRVTGSIGHFASFSFQSSKTLTCGDGGILICSDDTLALAARKAATIGFKDLTLKPGDNVVSEQLRCQPNYQRHDSIGWNQRLPEIAAAVALAELERIDELAKMRTYSANVFDSVVNDCEWIVPQKNPEGYVNAYWNYAARITRNDIVWSDFLATFIELGGDGFYGSYQPVHLEPVFANLNKSVDENKDRYPQLAGKLPRYERGSCPVWEKIQPWIIMLKTNYFDTVEADRQAEIFAKTIKRFD